MHIKHIHETLERLSEIACAETSKSIECINTCELGAVIDMIKDLAEAEYHSHIVKAMKEAEEDEEAEEKYMLKTLKDEYGEDDGKRYYDMWRYKSGRFAPKGRGTRRGYIDMPYHMTPDMYREHDPEYYRDMDRREGKMYYTEPITMSGIRDHREGKSGISRRTYMEAKEMHRGNTPDDKQHKMKELENYMGELSSDITEMINDASAEEKSLLKTKLQTLAQKIS